MFLLYWNKRKLEREEFIMAVASLVLGILSVVIGLFGSGFNWVGIIIGVIGLILAVLGKKDPKNAGMANAGLVLSIIGLVLSLILYVACVVAVSGAASFLDSLT